MSDLTRYRVPPGHMSDAEVRTEYGELYNRGGFRYIKDTTLQAIADAPRCEHGNIYPHGVATLHGTREGSGASLWYVDTCEGAPALGALLDALEGTDK